MTMLPWVMALLLCKPASQTFVLKLMEKEIQIPIIPPESHFPLQPFEIWSHYVVQAVLYLVAILLPHPQLLGL